jgi:hypothetical protein
MKLFSSRQSRASVAFKKQFLNDFAHAHSYGHGGQLIN